jgi:hypothetical protein
LRALPETVALASDVSPTRAKHTSAAAALTTFADACQQVPLRYIPCARRRIRSCRVRALPRPCSCCAAACAPGDHARASLQDKGYLGNERLQLLCCGCPLSALLLRLATVVDYSGRTSIQHMHVLCIMKRYLYGVALKLWNECLQ